MIESASCRYVTDGIGVLNEFVSAFPECKSVKVHLRDLMNDSGTVVIRYTNTTTWSVQAITPICQADTTPTATKIDPLAADERLTAAKLEPRAFEQYRTMKQMDHEMADKKLKQEMELAVALAERVTARELALADKITQRELALADKTTDRERVLAILDTRLVQPGGGNGVKKTTPVS